MQRTGIFFLLLFSLSIEWIWAEDKIFKRKDITGPNKKLEIRKGDLTDTKKLLRKTDGLSKTQIHLLRKQALKALGEKTYVFAVKNTPTLLKERLKYSWLIMQLEIEQDGWDRRKKRDAKRSGGKLTETRQKDYDKKFSKSNKKIQKYRTSINLLDQKMIVLSKKNSAHQTSFIKTTVGPKGARLTDKYGNFIVHLNESEEVLAKSHPTDIRYYEIKYNGKIVYSLKAYFIN